MDPDRKAVAKALDTPEELHIDSDRLTDPLPTVIEREVRPFEPMMHNDSWLAYWDDDGDGVDADTNSAWYAGRPEGVGRSTGWRGLDQPPCPPV
jgi:hypothetical protein